MIGFLFGFLNFIVALPGYILIALTLWGFFTTPKGESRLVNVLKTYAKVCSTVLEAAWAAQRMLPAKRPAMGFLGPVAALGGLRLPWLRIGLGAVAVAFCAVAVLTYGQSRFDAGQAKIKNEWEVATIKAMKAASIQQQKINDSADSLQTARVEKKEAVRKIVTEFTSTAADRKNEADTYRAAALAIRRVRERSGLPFDDIAALPNSA